MSNLTAGKLLIPYSRLARKKITVNTGPQGRIDNLRQIITELIRKERIEVLGFKGYEARQYAERLIELAKKHGDKHVGMMEMADYWILEKDLIPKLFKVIVPRYQNTLGPYTKVYKLPIEYPGRGIRTIIMELIGNPYPPVEPAKRDFSNSLTNILINACKIDQTKYKIK